MGFLDHRPDLAAGESQNTGNPVLSICTENRNGMICDTIYDGTGFPILIRYRVFAYLYLSRLGFNIQDELATKIERENVRTLQIYPALTNTLELWQG